MSYAGESTFWNGTRYWWVAALLPLSISIATIVVSLGTSKVRNALHTRRMNKEREKRQCQGDDLDLAIEFARDLNSLIVSTVVSAPAQAESLTGTVSEFVEPRVSWAFDEVVRRAALCTDDPVVQTLRIGFEAVVLLQLPPRVTEHDSTCDRRRPHDPAARLLPQTQSPLEQVDRFIGALGRLHEDLFAYAGVADWKRRFGGDGAFRLATVDAPMEQLKDVVLYLLVRLEHHAIGHSAELVAEAFMLMKVLASRPADIPDAWTALADRVDAAYCAMTHGQLLSRIAVLDDETVADRTRPANPEEYWGIEFDEEGNFLSIVHRLDELQGSRFARLMRPAAVDIAKKLVIFAPAELLRHDGHPVTVSSVFSQRSWASVMRGAPRQALEIAAHSCLSLAALHGVGLSHGSVGHSAVGCFGRRRGGGGVNLAEADAETANVTWALLVEPTVSIATPSNVVGDLEGMATFFEWLAAGLQSSTPSAWHLRGDPLPLSKAVPVLLECAQRCRSNSADRSAPLEVSEDVLRHSVRVLEDALGAAVDSPHRPPSYDDLSFTAIHHWMHHVQTAITKPKKAAEAPSGDPRGVLVKNCRFRRSFAEHGGLLAVLSTFSFFFRVVLWQWCLSYARLDACRNLQEPCFSSSNLSRAARVLAVADSSLCVACYVAQVRTLVGGVHTGRLASAVLHALAYSTVLVWLILLQPAVAPDAFAAAAQWLDTASVRVGDLEVPASADAMYVLGAVVLFLAKDICRAASPNGAGEFKVKVRAGGFRDWSASSTICKGLLHAANWTTLLVPFVTVHAFVINHPSSSQLLSRELRFFLPSLVSLGTCCAFNLFLIAVGTGLSFSDRGRFLQHTVFEGSLGIPAMFWVFNYAAYDVVMTQFIVPGIVGVVPGIFPARPWQQLLACYTAWAFSWGSFIFVSVALFAVMYSGWSLAAGIIVAFARGVGAQHTAMDVAQNMTPSDVVNLVCTRVLGLKCEGSAIAAAQSLWRQALNSLVQEHRLSVAECEAYTAWIEQGPRTDSAALGCSDDDHQPQPRPRPLRSADGDSVISTFVSMMHMMPEAISSQHSLEQMPSFTVVVPHYNETVRQSFVSMRARPRDVAEGVPSDARHAQAQLPEEADLLAEDLVRQGVVPPSSTGAEVVERYHHICHRTDLQLDDRVLVQAVERWVTYRSQTLARTVRGLARLREGLAAWQDARWLAANTRTDASAEHLADKRMQVLVATQCFTNAKSCRNVAHLTCGIRCQQCQATELVELQAEFPLVELVFPLQCSAPYTPRSLVEDLLLHCAEEAAEPGAAVALIHVDTRVTPLCGTRAHVRATRFYSCHLVLLPSSVGRLQRRYRLHAVERPGPLLLGPVYSRMDPRGLNTQGKAENQFHAAQFARGTNFFTLDMNQDICFTEGLKLPAMLYHYMGGPGRPRFGIVGFTERSYTRFTSLAGELAGSAEFAFVTIVQRALRSAIRVRMHYGHPDLISGLLVRTVGFHKASHGVNVSEDIFAGFECVARGVPIGFCEWIWFWKGRDTSLRLVAIFTNKISEGAAQIVRSRDSHFLYANLEWIRRTSLLLSTMGFYATSVLLATSIRLYIWALLLFRVGGVAAADLTAVGGVIGVTWIFQLGYVMAFPVLIENMVAHGLLRGLLRFIRFILPSIFFHSFMLQVVTTAFTLGLFTNAAAYVATGRGYDLAPVAADINFRLWAYSHHLPGMDLLVAAVWYAAVTELSWGDYFFRTFTIWIIIVALIAGPSVFQCPPSEVDLVESGHALVRWLLRLREHFGAHEQLVTREGIEEVERRSYRTWFARRFAAPMYAASLRGPAWTAFSELLAGTVYRELPGAALLLAYFELGMLPFLTVGAALAVQMFVLRKVVDGVPRSRLSQWFAIVSVVFVCLLCAVYVSPSDFFVRPFFAVLILLYGLRTLGLLYHTLSTARGTMECYIQAGMNLALFKFPGTCAAALLVYAVAWIASNVLRSALIAWSCSSRMVEEFLRVDRLRYLPFVNLDVTQPAEGQWLKSAGSSAVTIAPGSFDKDLDGAELDARMVASFIERSSQLHSG
jgi:hypothetical protein